MKERETFSQTRLFCPGPTPSPRLAATETDVYHRSREFAKTFQEVAAGLQELIGCGDPPIILASSGTGSLEGAMVNLTSPGDRIAVVEAGKFGERWRKLGETYGCVIDRIEVEWGRAPTAEAILAGVSSHDTKAVFLQANETSTGVACPLDQVIPAVRQKFAGLIVVDAISSLGAHAMKMDEWGIDVVCGGSQKGFGVAPGLAFVAIGPRARKEFSDRPRFYFDFQAEIAGQKDGKPAFTPAISLVQGMHTSLAEMRRMGFDAVVAHHARLARATRAGVAGAGLSLFPQEHPSQALTAIRVPEGMDGEALKGRLRDRFGMYFAGGQDALKGKILRMSHLGFVDLFHVIDGLAALEMVLAEVDPRRTPGDGVKAALQSFHES